MLATCLTVGDQHHDARHCAKQRLSPIDPANISDELLDTPVIAITSGAARLTFRNAFSLEDGFDGGVLRSRSAQARSQTS